jgi:antitoxin component YwqK of YwqJK toxin-antitoxin module
MVYIGEKELKADIDLGECYQGKPFTGVAYAKSPNGQLTSEVEYVDGRRTGRTRYWYDSGAPELDAQYVDDYVHGEEWRWDVRGQLREWVRAEFGITLEQKTWDASGKLVSHIVATEDDVQWKMVQYRRRAAAERKDKKTPPCAELSSSDHPLFDPEIDEGS